jgi:hypothetical protein
MHCTVPTALSTNKFQGTLPNNCKHTHTNPDFKVGSAKEIISPKHIQQQADSPSKTVANNVGCLQETTIDVQVLPVFVAQFAHLVFILL